MNELAVLVREYVLAEFFSTYFTGVQHLFEFIFHLHSFCLYLTSAAQELIDCDFAGTFPLKAMLWV